MKEVKLNSFALHPQIKANHANEESEKLTNHDTTPSSSPTPTGSSSPAPFELSTPPAPITGSY